jgi:hypothetical protein
MTNYELGLITAMLHELAHTQTKLLHIFDALAQNHHDQNHPGEWGTCNIPDCQQARGTIQRLARSHQAARQ